MERSFYPLKSRTMSNLSVESITFKDDDDDDDEDVDEEDAYHGDNIIFSFTNL